MINRRVLLCILDGWGIGIKNSGNAIYKANTKTFDYLIDKYPNTILKASENDVGLPNGQFGNSEVGHMNIGAGRIIFQDLLRINQSIKNGSFENNRLLKSIRDKCKIINIVALISKGGVHGHIHHLHALIKSLLSNKTKIQLHCILDGRDSPPTNGLNDIIDLMERIDGNTNINVSSISGRYYVMDRDNRWDRIEIAYRAIVEGNSKKRFSCPKQAIIDSYNNSLTDEFFTPICCDTFTGMKNNQGLIITNYRSDRVRQFLTSIYDERFGNFTRKHAITFAESLGMVEYSRTLSKHMNSIFNQQEIKNTLGEVISNNGLNQLRVAETEKYAHVTYFFNGTKEKSFSREDRVLVPSPRVKTYDLCPEMACFEVTKKIIENLGRKKYSFILSNYANTDMVGHTGSMEATIKAVEAVDYCIERIYKACNENGYTLVLTSDHGNADLMYDFVLNEICTTHSLNPVPFIICSDQNYNLKKGRLSDIGPTILELMEIKKPSQMNGVSIIK